MFSRFLLERERFHVQLERSFFSDGDFVVDVAVAVVGCLQLQFTVYSCSVLCFLFKQRELISARETSRQRIAYFSPRPSRAGVQFSFALPPQKP